jgi:hypothetical protein
MFSWHFFDRSPLRITALLILIVAGFALVAGPVGAAPCCGDLVLGAGLFAPTADLSSELMGNRTRMIQVCCVVVAIGIFVLSRSIK